MTTTTDLESPQDLPEQMNKNRKKDMDMSGPTMTTALNDMDMDMDMDMGSNHNASAHSNTLQRLLKTAKVVKQFRALMLMILIALAVVLAVLVSEYMKSVEDNEFQKEFQDNGNKVINAFSKDSYRKVRTDGWCCYTAAADDKPACGECY